MKTRRALVVLGMHRSGTSALTRMLGLLGATLPKHLMPATDSNPRGYFESQKLFELHEQLMRDAGTSWFDLAPFPANWVETPLADSWIERLAEACLEEFADSPFFVMKDPRMIRLLPIWTKVFDRLEIEPSYVLAVRNPLDVAASLNRAQGTDESKGMLLWLQYFLAAEHQTRGRPRCFQSYEALLADWRAVAADIAKNLHIVFPRRSRWAEAEIDAFLTPTLRHQATTPAQVAARNNVIDWVKEVYGWACEATSGKVGNTRRLDRVRVAFEFVEEACGPLLAKVELDRAKSDRRSGQLEAQVADLRSALTDSQHEAEKLSEHLDASRYQLAARGNEIREIRDRLVPHEDEGGRLVELVKFVLEAALGRLDETTTRELSTKYGGGMLAPLAETGLQLSQRAGEIELLRGDVARLREQFSSVEEIERMKHESADRAAALSRLSTEVGGLRDSVSRRDTRIEQLREETAKFAEEINREKLASQNLTKQLEARQAQIVDLEQKLQHSEARSEESARALAAQRAQLAEASNEGAALQRRLEARETQLSGLEEDLQRSATAAADRSRERGLVEDKLRAEAENRSRELGILEVKLGGAEKDLATTHNEITVQKQRLEARGAALEQDLRRLALAAENRSRELGILKGKLGSTETELATARDEMADQKQRLEARVAVAEQDLQHTSLTAEEQSRELGRLEDELRATEREFSMARDAMADRKQLLDARVAGLEEDLQHSALEAADRSRELGRLGDKLRGVEVELAMTRDDMIDQRQRLKARLAGLGNDLQQSAATAEESAAKAEAESRALAAELEKKTHELGVVRESLQRAEAELVVASNDLADREFCVRQLQSRLAALPTARARRVFTSSTSGL